MQAPAIGTADTAVCSAKSCSGCTYQAAGMSAVAALISDLTHSRRRCGEVPLMPGDCSTGKGDSGRLYRCACVESDLCNTCCVALHCTSLGPQIATPADMAAEASTAIVGVLNKVIRYSILLGGAGTLASTSLYTGTCTLHQAAACPTCSCMCQQACMHGGRRLTVHPSCICSGWRRAGSHL
jgi:hypothetical protein